MKFVFATENTCMMKSWGSHYAFCEVFLSFYKDNHLKNKKNVKLNTS